MQATEEDKLEVTQSSPPKLGFEGRPAYRSGVVLDKCLADNAVPVIEPISWVNIPRRKKRLHFSLRAGSGNRELVPDRPIQRSTSMRYGKPPNVCMK
jgi:hypothetical protein